MDVVHCFHAVKRYCYTRLETPMYILLGSILKLLMKIGRTQKRATKVSPRRYSQTDLLCVVIENSAGRSVLFLFFFKESGFPSASMISTKVTASLVALSTISYPLCSATTTPAVMQSPEFQLFRHWLSTALAFGRCVEQVSYTHVLCEP